MPALFLVLLCALNIPSVVEVAEASEQVRVAASERYRAGRIHRFGFGGGYRDLWEAEIELPLLDLEKEGGGLLPTRRFGGLQTAVLGFQGADGRTYTFRGTDKDPSAVLDPVLRNTIVQSLVQDQMAAQHPGGPIVAGVLSRRAGVMTIDERMVVMPDDPILGDFREKFAGMVGTFFEYPRPATADRSGFYDAVEIIDHEELYRRLESGNADVVDVEAFLRARLVDIFLGDFDRHRKQWRWAKLPGSDRWQPIPEDRDMAFVRYDGFGPRILKIYVPILQRYDREYPFIKGLTLHGWEQDRWLLPRLSWIDWERIIADIQSRIDDDTIARAVASLPSEYVELDGERLRTDITGRRDNLAKAARRFYEHLAREVDIQTSNASDDVQVVHAPDGTMLVEIRPQGGDAEQAGLIFRRVFDPKETRDVRLYLRDGDDIVRVRGKAGRIRLRVIASKGQKRLDDGVGGATRIYDSDHSVEVTAGRGTRVDRDDYELPPSESGFVDVENVPPRDWGSDTVPILNFGVQPDVGVFLGGAVAHTRYAFRRHPWSSKHSLAAGYAFEANAPRVRYQGLFRPENSKWIAGIDLEYSGIEVLRFYGFGNETTDRGNDRFFRVRNQQYRASSSVKIPLFDEKLRISTGPYLALSRTANGTRLIDTLNPYGNNDFGLVGAQLNVQFDTRRTLDTTLQNLELPFHENSAAGYPTSGFLIDLTGRISPPVWDVEKTYGSLGGSISGYLSLGDNARATLGARIGGEHTFGRTPYFDLAAMGGGRFFSGTASNRAFRPRRFTGDSAVFGNLDLRVFLVRLKIIVPGDLGVQGFFDAGRVFIDGEDSDNWHPSGGGGVWFSPLVRTNTISFSVAQGTEELLAYLRIGFHY